MRSFNGFPNEMTDFMWELRFNNNKEWFGLNRKRYEEYMKKPMEQFSVDMAESLKEVFGCEIYYNISRINRDIRYSKNKAPYRDNKWVVFKLRQGRWQDQPCMFLDISPEKWELGLGFYNGKPDFMRAFRKKVDAAPARFGKIAKSLEKHPEFVIEGDFYKRPMGQNHGETINNWYQRKNIAVITAHNISEDLYDGGIFNEARELFGILKPLMLYLNEIVF